MMSAEQTGKSYAVVDRLLEVAGWIMLLVLWVATLDTYLEVQDLIPIQFKFSGIITKFGDRITLLFYPLTASFMVIGLTLLARNPKVFTPQAKNNRSNIHHSIRLIRWLKIVVPAGFLVMMLFIRFTSLSGPVDHGNLVFPAVVMIVCLPPTYYIYKILLLKQVA